MESMDSTGGGEECVIHGMPAGVGEPVFDKLQSHLAYAMLSINGCKGFDYGSGFAGVTQMGEQANQVSGGISGGITSKLIPPKPCSMTSLNTFPSLTEQHTINPKLRR